MIKTLHDLTPPPTEPEQAPIKAPIKRRKLIDGAQPDVSPTEKPVVVIIETDWNKRSLITASLFDENKLISTVTKKIRKIIDIKNLNSGS